MSQAIRAKTARERATIAAQYIRRGGPETRAFEDCFMMGDSAEVIAILLEKATTDSRIADYAKRAGWVARLVIGDRVIRTDTPCIPGRVLALRGDEALVIWGCDEGSGQEPHYEQVADLELDITAEWYLAEKHSASPRSELR